MQRDLFVVITLLGRINISITVEPAMFRQQDLVAF